MALVVPLAISAYCATTPGYRWYNTLTIPYLFVVRNRKILLTLQENKMIKMINSPSMPNVMFVLALKVYLNK